MTTRYVQDGDVNNTDVFFAKYQKGGDDPTHLVPQTYSMNLQSHVKEKTRAYSRATGEFVSEMYYFGALYIYPDVLGSNGDLKLQSQIASDFRRTDFNLPVFAGEGLETLHQLLAMSSAVLSLIRSIYRLDLAQALRCIAALPGQKPLNRGASVLHRQLKKPPKVPPKFYDAMKLGDIPGAWVAIQWGVLPFLSDIKELAELYARRNDSVRVHRQRYRTSGEGRSFDATPYNSPYLVKTTTKQKLQYLVTFEEVCGTPRSLGMWNPLGLMWELTPLSAVVDWFIPIGTYLDNVSTLQGVKVSYVRTLFTEVIARVTQQSAHYPEDNEYYLRRGGSFNGHWLQLRRTTGISLDIALPSLKQFERTWSINHSLTASALLALEVAGAVDPGSPVKPYFSQPLTSHRKKFGLRDIP